MKEGNILKFSINNKLPIYEQIENNVYELILKYGIKEEDKMPSVRELATLLTVNPNTVSKAYSNLEKDQVIVTVKGSGTFVRKGARDVVMVKSYSTLVNKIKEVVLVAKNLEMNFKILVDLESEFFYGGEGKN